MVAFSRGPEAPIVPMESFDSSTPEGARGTLRTFLNQFVRITRDTRFQNENSGDPMTVPEEGVLEMQQHHRGEFNIMNGWITIVSKEGDILTAPASFKGTKRIEGVYNEDQARQEVLKSLATLGYRRSDEVIVYGNSTTQFEGKTEDSGVL